MSDQEQQLLSDLARKAQVLTLRRGYALAVLKHKGFALPLPDVLSVNN